MAERFVFQFDDNGTLDQLVQRIKSARAQIDRLLQDPTEPAGAAARDLIPGLDQQLERVRQLQREIQVLRNSVSNLDAPIGKYTRANLEAQGVQVPEGTTAAAEIEQRVNALKEEQVQLNQQLAQGEQQINQIRQEEADKAAFNNRLETERVNLLKQIQALQPGGGRLNELVDERANNLVERQLQLRKQLAEEFVRVGRLSREAQIISERDAALTAQKVAAQQALQRAVAERIKIEQQNVESGFGEGQRRLSSATEEERARFTKEEEAATRRLTDALKEEEAQRQRIGVIERQQAEGRRQLGVLETAGGATGGINEIQNRLNQVNEQLAQLRTNARGAVEGIVGPDFEQRLASVAERLQRLQAIDPELISPEERQELVAVQEEARNLLNLFERIGDEGIPNPVSEEELFNSLSRFQQIFIGAARDFGRRFTATLQFAISGALLFGVQRLAREFLDAAIEVERTFADISTALEFDIDAERGTAAFEGQVERVRRQVLQIADDFNALPTEVNEAAFQMVSRFSDVEAAVTATRAQVLATRIATIDQAEALRALTAVAESFGLSLAGVGSIQERQRRQADLYVEALDFATRIQQEFGVAVEDTLEGSAGLAELFRSLGFSIEETFAIVATTIRQTGVTGSVAFDRLGRSIGQITSPQTRDELLALANNFEELTLAPADFFDSGRTALFKIFDQFSDLDQSLQNRVSQILGQRRETQFVSALLQAAGAGEVENILDSLGDSSGAAEDRLATLLATVQGSIEGVIQQFQELAQNLERLGVISPISLLLKTLESVLNLLNEITKAAIDFFDALDNIRIPFTDWGLGDALKSMIALTTAALGFKAIMDAVSLTLEFKGVQSLLSQGKNFFATGVGVGAVGALSRPAAAGSAAVAAAAEQAATVGLFTRMRKALTGVNGSIKTSITALVAWAVAIGNSVRVTALATAAEVKLFVARTQLSTALLLVAAREAGFTATLAAVGGGVARLVTRIGSIAVVAAGAIAAFIALERLVRSIGSAIGIGNTRPFEETLEQLTQQRQQQALDEGNPLTEAEAQAEALRIRLRELEETLDGQLSGPINSLQIFFGEIFAAATLQSASNVAGSTQAQQQERAKVLREIVQAEVNNLQEEFNRAIEEAGLAEANQRGGLPPNIQQIKERIERFNAYLREVELDPSAGDNAFVDLGIANAVLDDLTNNLIPETEQMMLNAEGFFREFGEVLTIAQIQEAVQRINQQITLGQVSAREARSQIRDLINEAEEGLRQAQVKDADDVAQEYQDTLQGLFVSDFQYLQQVKQNRIDNASIIEDEQLRLRAELNGLNRTLREIIDNEQFGPEAENAIRREIQQKERELQQSIIKEARDRLEFAAANGRTFETRIEALRRLEQSLQEEIRIYRRIEAITGLDLLPLDLLEQLAGVQDNIAQEVVNRQQARARVSILSGASALDNIASLQANVADLRVELKALQKEGAEEIELELKRIDIREAITQLRQAQSARRQAFFRLTAGTGDEIAAAQAELRAARDALATILSEGGEGTQAAYEAELRVLQAQESLAQQALALADAERRAASDVTDSFEQALLSVQQAQQQLAAAEGPLEKARAQENLLQQEAAAQQQFYDRRLSDLDFLFQTDQLGKSAYISALRQLQSGVDRTTRKGEEIWRSIELQIRGLEDQASDLQFNIPTEIRLPTLFEVRRALAADSLGVNYQDNRQQDINVFVSDNVDLEGVVAAIESRFGGTVDVESARLATGGAGITIGGFN